MSGAAFAWAVKRGVVPANPFANLPFGKSISKRERVLSDDEIAKLQSMGHKLRLSNRQWGNMQVITWDFASGKVEAASDPRGEGEGLVY